MTSTEKRILRKAIRTDQLPSAIDPTQARSEDLDYIFYFGRLPDTGEGVASFQNEETGNLDIIFFE